MIFRPILDVSKPNVQSSCLFVYFGIQVNICLGDNLERKSHNHLTSICWKEWGKIHFLPHSAQPLSYTTTSVFIAKKHCYTDIFPPYLSNAVSKPTLWELRSLPRSFQTALHRRGVAYYEPSPPKDVTIQTPRYWPGVLPLIPHPQGNRSSELGLL